MIPGLAENDFRGVEGPLRVNTEAAHSYHWWSAFSQAIREPASIRKQIAEAFMRREISGLTQDYAELAAEPAEEEAELADGDPGE